MRANEKNHEQFTAELKKFIKNKNLVPIIDHTESILTQARVYRKEGEKEFACLFYAMWFEHTLNGFVFAFAKRMNLSDKEIEGLIRDTSYKSKFSWLLRLFGKEPFRRSQINLIIKLMETRNSFVHYKWKVEKEQADKEIEAILSKIGKTVKYVRDYEKNIYLEYQGAKLRT